MKKIITVISCMICFSILSAAGKNKNTINSIEVKNSCNIKVSGVVKMYGNMPFSYPGIETPDGKKYSIVSGNPKLLKKIRDCAGREITVYGIVNRPVSDDVKGFQMLKDGYLYVEDYEVVKVSKKKKK